MAALPPPPSTDVIGSGALAGAGVGASLGAVAAPLAVAPPRPTSGTVTSNDPLYQQALDQAKAALAAQEAPLQQQQTASDAYYASRQKDALDAYTTLSQLLQQLNVPGQIQGAYQTAGQDQALMGDAVSAGMKDALQGSSDGINSLLDKIGAPAGQQVGGNIPAAGASLASIYGAMPGESFEKQGAAQASAAAVLPAIALEQGRDQFKALGAQASTAHADFDNKIAALAGTLPGEVQKNYQTLQKLALDNAKFAETIKKDNFDQAYKIAQNKLAVAKYNTDAYYKGVSAQQRGQSLQLQAAKFARQQVVQDRQYAISLAHLGIAQKSLQLRIASAAYTQAHGGFTVKDIARFNSKLDALQASVNPARPVVGPNGSSLDQSSVDAKGKTVANATYANFISAALKKGVPIQLAIQRADTIWPVTQRQLPPSLAQMPALANEQAQQTLNHQIVTGSVPGMAKLSAVQRQEAQGILNLASQYLGTPYVYGGESPGGFDCSGLAQYLYAQEGINIPRTSYDQWQSGVQVPKGALQAGDLVFFKGSDSINRGGQLLPGHVGIFIGNGKFIEAPHTGAVVRISTLAGYPGYMGARRYVNG